MSITKKQQEKIDQAKQEKLRDTLLFSQSSASTSPFSAKVDSFKLDCFKGEIEKFNEKNPTKKLKIGKVIENLMYDFYKELKILNTEEEQQNLDFE